MSARRKSILSAAIVLAAASVITRILGFVYRVYMTQAIGAEGMGLYQLIMPLYSLAWAISCSGFTTAVSRLVAAENAKNAHGNMGRVLKQALLISVGISVLLSAALYFGANGAALYFLKDSRVALSLRILAACFPFMAAGSAIRGYFLGLRENVVPAVSQVLEQLVRMAVMYFLGASFMSRGLEFACAAAAAGIVAGELLSFVYVFCSHAAFKRKNGLTKKPTLAPFAALTAILAMAVPLTLNRVTGSLLAALENLLIPERLEAFGMTRSEALSVFGQINGMALPLIFFPSALLFALATTLVPAISEAAAAGDKKRISSNISKAILFTSIVGVGAASVFLVMPYEIGMTVYKQDIAELLFLLGIMCPFWYLGITFSGILNGLGEQLFLFKNSLLSSAINLAFIIFCVPKFGVRGFIVGWFISLLVGTAREIVKIGKSAEIRVSFGKCFVKPLISAAAAGLLVRFVSRAFIFPNLTSWLGLFAAIAAIAVSYSACIIALRCISPDEIRALFKDLKSRLRYRDKKEHVTEV